jgi:DNA-binding MarR family transcriptional regulator
MHSGLVEKHEGALDNQMSVRLWLRMLSATMVVEKRLRRRFADRFGTTLPRFDVLAALNRNRGGMTMSALSRALLVSNGNVTALVQTLTRDTYVVVRPSDEDGRVSLVALTDRGAAHFAEMADTHRQWIEAMFGGVTTSQQTKIYALLGVVKASLAEEDV